MERCAESSHINPRLGRGLLLSPSHVFSVFVSASVCFSGCVSFFPDVSLLTSLSSYSAQICLTALSLEDNVCRVVLSVPLTSTGGQCCWQMSRNSKPKTGERLLCAACVLRVCVVDFKGSGERDRRSQWLFRWNREPFPGCKD